MMVLENLAHCYRRSPHRHLNDKKIAVNMHVLTTVHSGGESEDAQQSSFGASDHRSFE